jgi:ornithine--oxo-acid transaminase
LEIKKSAGTARHYTEKLMKLGVLAKDTHGQTIRFAPPLVVTEKQIDWMLKMIKKVLED